MTYTPIEASVFTASASGSWVSYDLFTNKGVPKGAIAEIVIRNGNTDNERSGGVRAKGSSIDRRFGGTVAIPAEDHRLHEAEGGGYTTGEMLVKTDPTDGTIEVYAEVNVDVDFVLIGYFEGCGFTEKFVYMGTPDTTNWVNKNLAGYGVPANAVCQFSIINTYTWQAQDGGVRENGSSLERKIAIDEAEGLGANPLSMITKADASSVIEWTGDSIVSGIHIFLLGWFSSIVDFTEGFTLTNPGSKDDGVWVSKTLTEPPASSIVAFALVHQDSGSETNCGLREEGSSQERKILEHEAEGGGGTGFMACITLDADKKCEVLCDDGSEALFYYMGYFTIPDEDSADLLAKCAVRQENSANLFGKLTVGQGSEDLSTKLIVVQAASLDLLSRFIVVITGTRNLSAKFDVLAFTSEDLSAKFEVGQGTADLLGKFSVELPSSSAELPAKVEIQNSESAELLGKTVITIPWISGWSFRKKVTLVEQSGGTYNDYPTIITVAYDPHMKNDFADCRFTEADGTTLIPYGIVEKTDGVSCSFVIKRDYTPGCTLAVYLYYGNPDADDASVDHGPWALAWYLANGFGQNPSAYTDTNCAAYPHSASEAIPAWAAIAFGGCTANGGYRTYYGRVKINGVAVAWASTVVCNGIGNALQLKWKKYSCTNEQYDHVAFVSGASNTVTWGHYSGGNTGFWVSYYPTDPSVSLGGEAGWESEDLLGKFDVGQGARDLLARLTVSVPEDSEDLPARLTVKALAFEDLLGRVEIGRDSEDLLAKLTVIPLEQGSKDLLGRFKIRQDSEDLLARLHVVPISVVGSGPYTILDGTQQVTPIEQQRRLFRNPRGQKYYYALLREPANNVKFYKSFDGSVWSQTGPTVSATASSLWIYEDSANSRLLIYVLFRNSATGDIDVHCYKIDDSTSDVALLWSDASVVVEDVGETLYYQDMTLADDGYLWITWCVQYSLGGATRWDVYTTCTTSTFPLVDPAWEPETQVFDGSVVTEDTGIIKVEIVPLSATADVGIIWGYYHVTNARYELHGRLGSYAGVNITLGNDVPLSFSLGISRYFSSVVETGPDSDVFIAYETSIINVRLLRWDISAATAFGDTVYAGNVNSVCAGIDKASSPDKIYIFYVKAASTDILSYNMTGADVFSLEGEINVDDGTEAIDWLTASYEDWLRPHDLQVAWTRQTSYEARWYSTMGRFSRDLPAKFETARVADLYAKFVVGIGEGSADLFARCAVHREDSAEILVRFEVGQDSEGLLGKLAIRHSTSVDLPAKSITRHADDLDLPSVSEIRNLASTNLQAKIDITHSITLLGRCVIRHVGIVDLLGSAKIRQAGVPLELSAKFQVMHWKVLFTKSWIRHHHYLWTNRHYVNGVVELDEERLSNPFLGYVIQGVMDDIKSWLINEDMLVYDSWTDITRTPKLIRRATTYGTVASLYARDANNPHRRIVMGLRPVRIRAVEERAASERAMDYWETRMEKMMTLYLTSGGRRLMFVDTEDEEPVFSMEDIPFYTEDPYKIKTR